MTRDPGVPPASDPASRAAEPPMATSGPPVSFRNLYPRYPGYTPRRARGLGVPGLAIWKGDRVTASVAAASVVAKVSRDRMMRDLHERYPLYGFDRHKGYVTDEHVAALAEHGPSPVHRYSFVNVTRAAALAVPVAPNDPANLLEPADLLGDADPAVDDPAGALVAAALGPAGALGENERRM